MFPTPKAPATWGSQSYMTVHTGNCQQVQDEWMDGWMKTRNGWYVQDGMMRHVETETETHSEMEMKTENLYTSIWKGQWEWEWEWEQRWKQKWEQEWEWEQKQKRK